MTPASPPLPIDLDKVLPPCARNFDSVSDHGPAVPLSQRVGVCWHFDDSSSDRGAESWFRDPAFTLSYNRAYTDKGERLRLTPSIYHAAYHAGVWKLDPLLKTVTLSGSGYPYGWANGGYFGLAITAGIHDVVTDAQFAAIVEDTAVLFRAMGLTSADVETRLVGHNTGAIFSPQDKPHTPALWGHLGRKIDPIGADPNHPVLSLNAGRAAVAALLDDLTAPFWATVPFPSAK